MYWRELGAVPPGRSEGFQDSFYPAGEPGDDYRSFRDELRANVLTDAVPQSHRTQSRTEVPT